MSKSETPPKVPAVVPKFIAEKFTIELGGIKISRMIFTY